MSCDVPPFPMCCCTHSDLLYMERFREASSQTVLDLSSPPPPLNSVHQILTPSHAQFAPSPCILPLSCQHGQDLLSSILFLAALAPSWLRGLFSSCGKQGLPSGCGAGFSLLWLLCCRAQAPKCMGFSSCSFWSR